MLQDEVHERDRFSDFLLTKLRDMLQKHSTLKLILSSAALDVNLFLRYFGGCPVIYSKFKYFLKIPVLNTVQENMYYSERERECGGSE